MKKVLSTSALLCTMLFAQKGFCVDYSLDKTNNEIKSTMGETTEMIQMNSNTTKEEQKEMKPTHSMYKDGYLYIKDDSHAMMMNKKNQMIMVKMFADNSIKVLDLNGNDVTNTIDEKMMSECKKNMDQIEKDLTMGENNEKGMNSKEAQDMKMKMLAMHK